MQANITNTQEQILATLLIKEREKARVWFNNLDVFKSGWRQVFCNAFRDWSFCRRLLGGKWELWVFDKGTMRAVLTWHPVKDWSEKVLPEMDAVVARAIYRRGRRLRFDF